MVSVFNEVLKQQPATTGNVRKLKVKLVLKQKSETDPVVVEELPNIIESEKELPTESSNVVVDSEEVPTEIVKEEEPVVQSVKIKRKLVIKK